MVVGLTGQTGSGKTTVSSVFAQSGFYVINADEVARDVMNIGTLCLQAVQQEFGTSVLSANHSLDRKALGDIVFSDQQKLQQLNNIVNPYITQMIQHKIDQCKQPYILLDAPTLFESGADVLCDWVISLLADPQVRKNRIMMRDGLTEQRAEMRINAQHDDDYYISRSNDVVYNNGSVEQLAMQIAQVINRYQS